jgi:hypothetical protein
MHMANEGSTKPTYSELERLAKAATPGPWGWYRSDPNWLGAWCLETQSFSPTLNVEAVEASDEDRAFIAAANPQTILDLLAELARVRGLLQRTSENMEAMCLAIARNDGVMCAETVNMAAKLAISLRAGAESADIGKLDTADEKMCKCGHSDEEHDDGRLCCTHRKSASLFCSCNEFVSAETGGEKAE